jgi:ParB family chromosome partitioning protein
MSEQTTKAQASKKQGLGRGLGSLLGAESEHGAFSKTTPDSKPAAPSIPIPPMAAAKEPAIKEGFIEAPRIPDHLRIWNLAIENLIPNPKQPRQIFVKEALQELADSIKEKGIIQPLLVRKKADGKYEIIAGERRWRAAQLAGLTEVPAVLKTSEDQEVLELALIENIQRENLNPVEEAEAYEYLMQKYGLTQQVLAAKVGKDRSSVANMLRLLSLHPDIRKMMTLGEISLGHAKVLLSVADSTYQRELALKSKKENLSVRALEKLTMKAKVLPSVQTDIIKNKHIENLQEELQKLMGSKVGIDYSEGKGKISVNFYSDEELNQLVDGLRASWQK